MDLHLVASLPSGDAFEVMESGDLRASREALEANPGMLILAKFRDAYLYVEPSQALRAAIVARIGRIGGRVETGRIFDGPEGAMRAP